MGAKAGHVPTEVRVGCGRSGRDEDGRSAAMQTPSAPNEKAENSRHTTAKVRLADTRMLGVPRRALAFRWPGVDLQEDMQAGEPTQKNEMD